MRYERVCVEAFGYLLPEERWTSEEIEGRLAPVYERLRLSEGRLELMTGIKERRVWPQGALPSELSARTAECLLRRHKISPEQIGVLVHASVSRDFLEPATASLVHGKLGLGARCLTFDLSNACLGLMDAIVLVANMIEMGQCGAGIVVGTESSRCLLENTIKYLNEHPKISRDVLKLATASLTIGSASAAILLTDIKLSRTRNRLLGGVAWAYTAGASLCHSTADAAGGDLMTPLMWTDSDLLLTEGVKAAREAFGEFLTEIGWTTARIDKTVCHQVTRIHRKVLLETLGLDSQKDLTTYEWLGNTGSVALPVTAALAAERGDFQPGDRIALMGIGSGINVIMLAVEWEAPEAPNVSSGSS